MLFASFITVAAPAGVLDVTVWEIKQFFKLHFHTI